MGVIVVKLPSDQMIDQFDKVVVRLVGVLAPTSK
jgi:hypothetical protein